MLSLFFLIGLALFDRGKTVSITILDILRDLPRVGLMSLPFCGNRLTDGFRPPEA